MNYRNTLQKQIILDVIDKQGHVTVDQLIKLLDDKNVSLATIYRNLSILSDESKIKKIQSRNLTLYETVKENHYHFECTNCHKIIDIDKSLISIKVDKDITGITGKDVFLYGLCDDCKILKEGE